MEAAPPVWGQDNISRTTEALRGPRLNPKLAVLITSLSVSAVSGIPSAAASGVTAEVSYVPQSIGELWVPVDILSLPETMIQSPVSRSRSCLFLSRGSQALGVMAAVCPCSWCPTSLFWSQLMICLVVYRLNLRAQCFFAILRLISITTLKFSVWEVSRMGGGALLKAFMHPTTQLLLHYVIIATVIAQGHFWSLVLHFISGP